MNGPVLRRFFCVVVVFSIGYIILSVTGWHWALLGHPATAMSTLTATALLLERHLLYLSDGGPLGGCWQRRSHSRDAVIRLTTASRHIDGERQSCYYVITALQATSTRSTSCEHLLLQSRQNCFQLRIILCGVLWLLLSYFISKHWLREDKCHGKCCVTSSMS